MTMLTKHVGKLSAEDKKAIGAWVTKKRAQAKKKTSTKAFIARVVNARHGRAAG